MKREISFGKIDYNNTGKKNCLITIDIEVEDINKLNTNFATLETIENYTTVSICGNIWNPRKTDCYSCGQNLDTIAEYIGNNPKFKRIYKIWKMYHLNDFKPGTQHQCDAVKLWRIDNNITGSAYNMECEYLTNIGLNPDRGIHYGRQWMVEIVPDDIINELENL